MGFNPSQVGYKLLIDVDFEALYDCFNPSQVGYKLAYRMGRRRASCGFNPSQVGYKPTPPAGRRQHLPARGIPSELKIPTTPDCQGAHPACPLASILYPIGDSKVKSCSRSRGDLS